MTKIPIKSSLMRMSGFKGEHSVDLRSKFYSIFVTIQLYTSFLSTRFKFTQYPVAQPKRQTE